MDGSGPIANQLYFFCFLPRRIKPVLFRLSRRATGNPREFEKGTIGEIHFWMFINCSQLQACKQTAVTGYNYAEFIPISSDQPKGFKLYLPVYVLAAHDAHILLAPEQSSEGDVYEIGESGWTDGDVLRLSLTLKILIWDEIRSHWCLQQWACTNKTPKTGCTLSRSCLRRSPTAQWYLHGADPFQWR